MTDAISILFTGELLDNCDRDQVMEMRAREVSDPEERARLWAAAAEAYPPYNDYQAKTDRTIPVFALEPR